MPTVAEILKQSGFSDDDIAKFDAKAITAFTGVLTTAENEKKTAADALVKAEATRLAAENAEKEARQRVEKAELVERSNKDFYEGTIVTALNGWDDEKKKIEGEKARNAAEAAFYKTQAEEAKKSGFIPGDAPAFTYTPSAPTPGVVNPPTRDGQGRYLANVPGATPGSPTLMDDVRSALSDTTWTMQQYSNLYGAIYPGDVMVDAAEATSLKLPYRQYIERKYKFSERRDELQRQAQEKHDNELRATVTAEYDVKLKAEQETAKTNLEKARQEWAERTGNNPDVRAALPSKMAEVSRAVKDGQRPDPLTLNSRERTKITRQQINERITAQESAA
jgi:hypothetical protein